eukprot:1148682-Pelagomonas_calceolata.AAC.16
MFNQRRDLRCKGTNAQKQHGKSLASSQCNVHSEETEYHHLQAVTPDELDHRPVSRSSSNVSPSEVDKPLGWRRLLFSFLTAGTKSLESTPQFDYSIGLLR